MAHPPLLPEHGTQIAEIVAHYNSQTLEFARFGRTMQVMLDDAPTLASHVHSMKWRIKDPSHLQRKLEKKAHAANERGEPFDINLENYYSRINDLVGFRILHLYTKQLQRINEALLPILDQAGYAILEGPVARTWDDESRSYFRSINVETRESATLYTSVHYVVLQSQRTRRTAEIQVRTLAEELWGEVDHSINYPIPSPQDTCSEQIKVLARFTSGCTRLVDSIFRAHEGRADPANTMANPPDKRDA